MIFRYGSSTHIVYNSTFNAYRINTNIRSTHFPNCIACNSKLLKLSMFHWTVHSKALRYSFSSPLTLSLPPFSLSLSIFDCWWPSSKLNGCATLVCHILHVHNKMECTKIWQNICRSLPYAIHISNVFACWQGRYDLHG